MMFLCITIIKLFLIQETRVNQIYNQFSSKIPSRIQYKERKLSSQTQLKQIFTIQMSLKNLTFNNYILREIQTMSILDNKQEMHLHIKAVTWHKDSHSLFDYQFNKNVTQQNFDISLNAKFVFMYRDNKNSEIKIKENNKLQPLPVQNLQLLGCFQLKSQNKKYKLQFHHASEFRDYKKQGEDVLKTEESVEITNIQQPKDEQIYLIVRSLKNKQNQNKGYKLQSGQIIKLGRVEYKISSMKKKGVSTNSSVDPTTTFLNSNISECQRTEIKEDDQCKYCLEGELNCDQFFFISPCKCSGSAGLVHFKCLEQWIQSKVKKQVTGGTLHYNFQKFFCELCKYEFPRFIKKGESLHQLMHIDKPEGPHMILQGITQKSKNLMVIQNIPEEGIKIGRSHQCQIRIQDISVSRNHAFIQKIDDDFVLFDSKSKFGTLVRENNLSLQLNKIKQGIQIGRTVFTFEIDKK